MNLDQLFTNLEKLGEGLNENILTDEMKTQITQMFDAEIEKRVVQKEVELMEKYSTLKDDVKESVEGYDDKIDRLSEEYDAKIEALSEKYEEETKEYYKTLKSDLTEKINSYLDYVVKEFIEEHNQDFMNETIANEAVILHQRIMGLYEGYNANFENLSQDSELVEANKKLKENYNKLFQELTETKATLQDAAKTFIVEEFANKNFNTLNEKEKFKSIAEDYDFDEKNSQNFINKLNAVKHLLSEKNEDAEDETLTEDVSEEKKKDIIVEETEDVVEETTDDDITEYIKMLHR